MRPSIDLKYGLNTREYFMKSSALHEDCTASGNCCTGTPAPSIPDLNLHEKSAVVGFVHFVLNAPAARMAALGGSIILFSLLPAFMGLADFAAVSFTIATLIALYPVAHHGLNALITRRTVTINILMTVAALGALILGEYAEAAIVTFLFALGEALEGYTDARAHASIRALLSLTPETALRIDDDGSENAVLVEKLAVGELVRVRAGDRLPVDGIIESGSSEIDQSPVTGESVPLFKQPGDPVYAGTLNGAGTLIVQVTHTTGDNTINRIIRLVEDAARHRAPIQRTIDAFARWYTPAVMIAAALIAIVPPLLGMGSFWDVGAQHGWLYRALSMLVIACPCALVISAPITLISATTRAARAGVLIKGGSHLETLAGIRTLAFDKTGTLTRAQPTVTKVQAIACPDAEPCDQCDEVLALAAALEQGSAHPIAHAIERAAVAQGVERRYSAHDIQTQLGRGISGQIDGQPVLVGSHAVFEDIYPHSSVFCQHIRTAESAGHTTMMVVQGDSVRGFIAVRDELRPETSDVMAELHTLGLRTAMLTGDHEHAALSLAQQAGIDDVRAGLLPADKVTAVQQLRQAGPVAMIGDGINDTPALAAAAVGVAMGGASSHQALDTADVVLLHADLWALPFIIRLARLARAIIRQNIALSFGVKLMFLVLAACGLADMWLAILADVGMLMLVIGNSLRPLRLH